jgi:hypothetical protein
MMKKISLLQPKSIFFGGQKCQVFFYPQANLQVANSQKVRYPDTRLPMLVNSRRGSTAPLAGHSPPASPASRSLFLFLLTMAFASTRKPHSMIKYCAHKPNSP